MVVELSSGEKNIFGLKCQPGDCPPIPQCNQECLMKGYKAGGTCYGFFPKIVRCCCHEAWVIVLFNTSE